MYTSPPSKIAAVRSALSPVITPMFRVYWRFSRPMTLGVRVVLRDGDGAFLLIKHTYRPGWYLPGGGVEVGETADLAARRETEEETGFAVEGPLRLLGFYHNHRFHRNDHVVLFEATAFGKVGEPRPAEIAAAGFFQAGALPEDATPSTRQRIAELTGQVPVSLEW
jgi:8-oxo-dGTP pyrophosphatase MutT (NUDIX family)